MSIHLDKMSLAEKQFCLALVLTDIRGSWLIDLNERVAIALEIATQVGSHIHIEALKEFSAETHDGVTYTDGRFFRCSWEHGGYEGAERIHNMDANCKTVSDAVHRFVAENCNNPEYLLENYEDPLPLPPPPRDGLGRVFL